MPLHVTIVAQKLNNMKKQLILSGIFMLISVMTFAQQKEAQKREIKKEVEMTEENGQKKLVIKTEENGKVTEEVYKGEEADKKLAELKGEHKTLQDGQETVEIKMEEVNGEKKLTVIENKGGMKAEKVYVGEEAEQKLKEYEQGKPAIKPANKVKMQRKQSVKKKSVN